MPTTIIFGGSGRVARLLTTTLKNAVPSHNVVSIIRSAEQSESLRGLGAVPVVQSVEDSSVADIRTLFERESPDYVVWSAGAGRAGRERTLAVDRDGAIKVMDALATAQYTTSSGTTTPKRFVIVSSIDVRDREKPVPSWYNKGDLETSDGAWKDIDYYLLAKLAADKALVTGNAQRGLRYTIVRPGYLSSEPASGIIQAGRVSIKPTISREDVAISLAEILKNDDTVGLAFNIVGADEDHKGLPIAEAIAQAGKSREDVFEGYY